MKLLSSMIGTRLSEASTKVVAGGAVTSPIWLSTLEAASQQAALIAPILGVVWLTVQIVYKVIEIKRKVNHEN